MKNRNFKHRRAPKPAKPFTGMVNQLNRYSLILVNLGKFEGFKKALAERGIDYELGDFYGDGIFVVKKYEEDE